MRSLHEDHDSRVVYVEEGLKYSGAIVGIATRLMWGPDWESNTFYMDSAGMFDAFNESPMYGDEWTHAAKIMTAEEVWFGYEYTASIS